MFSERIKSLRKRAGITQIEFAKIFNISNGTIAMWETGKREPDFETIQKIADYFNVTTDYLLGRTDTSDSPRKKGVKIPVLGRVQAGIPVEAIEYIIDYEEIIEEEASRGDFFGLVIRGDSMAPRMIEGDVVIVRKQSYIDSGDTAIVLINGQDATCKKVQRHRDGISLLSYNSAFEPMFFSNKEIETLPVQIIGKVVELRGKM